MAATAAGMPVDSAWTRSCGVYTFRKLEAMYRDAGFGRVAGHPVPNGPHTVVTGHAR